MKTIFRIALLATVILSARVSGLGHDYIEGQNALSEARPQSCQAIIDTSTFYGNCCSLSDTSAGGCVVNIKNGWCRIIGQYWRATWNSTDEGLECDPSSYTIDYIIASSRPSGAPSGSPTGPSSQPSNNPSSSPSTLPTSSTFGPNANSGDDDSAATGVTVGGVMALSAAVSAFLF